ncbi:MAG: metalloregulator ArsR/SmtB family transcription factor [Bacteroidota bacterium]
MKLRKDLGFLESSTETLRAMAHPIRLAMVDLLHTKKELSVTEVFTELNIQQAVASHHLRIMKNKNIVRVSRQGQNSIYSLSDPAVYDILPILKKILY